MRSDDFEPALAGLCGLCKLSAKLNLGNLERVVAGLCELGTQTAAAARLSIVSVVQTGAVHEGLLRQCILCLFRQGLGFW